MAKTLLVPGRLNELRREAGAPWKCVARDARVSHATLGRYFGGGANYNTKTLLRILDVINAARVGAGLKAADLKEVLAPAGLMLTECLDDFVRWYGPLAGEALALRVIAIDMTAGRENLVRLVNGFPSAMRIELLMYRHDSRRRTPHGVVGSTLQTWGKAADAHLELLRSQFVPHRGGRLELVVGRYAAAPALHGMAAAAGGQSRFYVTRCRRRRGPLPDFHHGDGDYRVADGADDSAAARELRAAFEARWAKLRGGKGDIVLGL